MNFTYEGRVLAIVEFDPLIVDVKLHLNADVGFDMHVYFGTFVKRLPLLNCDKQKGDLYPSDVANLILDRNLKVVTHKGMRLNEYACELFDVHGNNINEELRKLGWYV